jgi:hypothetical protein
MDRTNWTGTEELLSTWSMLRSYKRKKWRFPGSGQVGFVVDKVALGQVFSEFSGFPCQSSFHQLLHNHPRLSPGASTIGQKWPQYKGLSPTPLAIKKKWRLIFVYPTLYSIYKWYVPNTWCLSRSLCWWHLYTYATDRKEVYVLRKLQRGLSAIETWCEGCNIKINEG